MLLHEGPHIRTQQQLVIRRLPWPAERSVVDSEGTRKNIASFRRQFKMKKTEDGIRGGGGGGGEGSLERSFLIGLLTAAVETFD